MTQGPDLSADLADLDSEGWRAQMFDWGEEHGYFEKLGADHSAMFIDAGRKLLVTFENSAELRATGARPMGLQMAQRENWSLLAIFSETESWFRDPRLWAYFDRLCDDGFLEDFDSVLFAGHHQGGHAAAAYSVASPGARILAFRPVATLDPQEAGWDKRYRADRRTDFNSRYGYAPDMAEAARALYLIHDPLNGPDAAHAALFRPAPRVLLPARGAGQRLTALFGQFGLMPELLSQAMDGALTPASFARAWRVRRDQPPYLRQLSRRLGDRHPRLLAALCRHGMTTRDAEFFRQLAGEAQPAAAGAAAE